MEQYIGDIFQSLSSALLLLCLWLAKRLYERVDKMEAAQHEQRLGAERAIAQLRLETTTKCLEIEKEIQSLKKEN